MDKKTIKRSVFSYLILAVVIMGIFYFMGALNNKVNTLTYSEFLKDLKDNKVTELVITQDASKGIYTLTGKEKGYNENETFEVS